MFDLPYFLGDLVPASLQIHDQIEKMPLKASHLWAAPEVNPVNLKARSIPVLNPLNKYGRTFFFSWLGFMVAFLSWYAFPPLLNLTIRKDLHMSQNEYSNSNIMALTGTLVVRLISGPLCDKFGPRYVFVGCLLAGAIPTALAGTVTTPTGIIVLRFFVGVLGASFVPCQVWCTGFFDKNVVGTANALAGGLGNSGGGITVCMNDSTTLTHSNIIIVSTSSCLPSTTPSGTTED